MVGILIGIALYLGVLALTLWVFYVIIRTAVKNGILKADEERIRRQYPDEVTAADRPQPWAS